MKNNNDIKLSLIYIRKMQNTIEIEKLANQ